MLASFNIVSLRRHIHELEIILREYNIDILTLNETRLELLIDDNEVGPIPAMTVLGGRKTKYSDEKTIHNNSNKNICRNLRLIHALCDGSSSSVTKIWPFKSLKFLTRE